MKVPKHDPIRLKDKVIVGALFSASLVVGAALVYSLKKDEALPVSDRSHLPPASVHEWLAGVVVEPSLLTAWTQEFKQGASQSDNATQWVAACVNAPPPPAHEMRAKAWLERLEHDIDTQEFHVPDDGASAEQDGARFVEVLPVLQGYLAVAPQWPPSPGDHFVIRTLGKPERVTVDSVAAITWQRGEERLVNVVRMPDIQGGFSLYQDDGTPWRKGLFSDRPLKQAFPVSSRFSMARKHPVTGRMRPHTGVDFMTPVGTPLIAQADGRVKLAGRTRGNGYYLVVEYPGGIEATYLHLKRFASRIETGVAVSKGQVIAQTGNTGLSSGPHLHYELKVGGVKVDPLRAVLPVDYALAPVLENEFENYLAVLRRDDIEKGVTPMTESLADHMLAAAVVSSVSDAGTSADGAAGLP
jgi:murein DD-endopeptidase MepM/ murein hydrolase activator NlpD